MFSFSCVTVNLLYFYFLEKEPKKKKEKLDDEARERECRVNKTIICINHRKMMELNFTKKSCFLSLNFLVAVVNGRR